MSRESLHTRCRFSILCKSKRDLVTRRQCSRRRSASSRFEDSKFESFGRMIGSIKCTTDQRQNPGRDCSPKSGGCPTFARTVHDISHTLAFGGSINLCTAFTARIEEPRWNLWENGDSSTRRVREDIFRVAVFNMPSRICDCTS